MSTSVAVVCLGNEAHPRVLTSLANQDIALSVFIAHQTRLNEANAPEEDASSMKIIRWKFFRPLTFADRMNRLMSLVFARWENEDLDTKWVCFLDGEATLARGALTDAISALQADLTLGSVSPVICAEERTHDGTSDEFQYVRTEKVVSAGYLLSPQRMFLPMYEGMDVRNLPMVPWNAFGCDGRVAIIRASTIHRAMLNRDTVFYPWIREEHAWLELNWRLRWMGERCLCFPRIRAWCTVSPESVRDKTLRQLCIRSVRALHDPIVLRLWTFPSIILRSAIGIGRALRYPSCIHVWLQSFQDVIPRIREYKALRRSRRVSMRMARGWFSEPGT